MRGLKAILTKFAEWDRCTLDCSLMMMSLVIALLMMAMAITGTKCQICTLCFRHLLLRALPLHLQKRTVRFSLECTYTRAEYVPGEPFSHLLCLVADSKMSCQLHMSVTSLLIANYLNSRIRMLAFCSFQTTSPVAQLMSVGHLLISNEFLRIRHRREKASSLGGKQDKAQQGTREGGRASHWGQVECS